MSAAHVVPMPPRASVVVRQIDRVGAALGRRSCETLIEAASRIVGDGRCRGRRRCLASILLMPDVDGFARLQSACAYLDRHGGRS